MSLDKQTLPVPEVIYIQTGREDYEPDDFPLGDEGVTWCRDKIHPTDIEYRRTRPIPTTRTQEVTRSAEVTVRDVHFDHASKVKAIFESSEADSMKFVQVAAYFAKLEASQPKPDNFTRNAGTLAFAASVLEHSTDPDLIGLCNAYAKLVDDDLMERPKPQSDGLREALEQQIKSSELYIRSMTPPQTELERNLLASEKGHLGGLKALLNCAALSRQAPVPTSDKSDEPMEATMSETPSA